ncbi:MAG: helix-turn-helix domain-containing protein [Nitrospirae bacterium]|nr:helix-turn-helix domain-containing protein [Nitrospirota bacterium]
MEAIEAVQKSVTKRKASEGKRKFFGADFKLQIVRKYLEEGVPVPVILQECGVSKESVRRWVRAYRSEGEAGLLKSHNGKGRSLPAPVKKKIVEIKEAVVFQINAAQTF